MDIVEAQRSMRRAFVGGGPGVFISATVWFTAAVIERMRGAPPGFATLFFGGMLIFPLSTLISRRVFLRSKTGANNPLGATALESTIGMIGGLIAAWLFLSLRPDYAFPVAAIAVGTHYCVFKTVYGDKTFLALAAIITGLGVLGIFGPPPVRDYLMFAVALAELAFAVILTARALRRYASGPDALPASIP